MRVISPISKSYLTKGKGYELIDTFKSKDGCLVGGTILDDANKLCFIVFIEKCPHLKKRYNWIILKENDHERTEQHGPSHH